MELSEFSTYRHSVTELQKEDQPRVLFGIEADYYEGCEGFLGEWLPSQGFDFVLGSVHYIKTWGFDDPAQRHVWETVDVASAWRAYFDLIGRLADSRLFDAVGHLDLPKKFGYRPSDHTLRKMAGPALDRVAKAGMGMEINTSGLRKPVGKIYPCPLLIAMACERGIPICFGSDAHRPEDVGADFDYALDLARGAGYTHYFRVRQRSKELLPLPQA
jgi:histidinol-phosphatase (PHP family)